METNNQDKLRDSDRARLALMLLSWELQQADGLAIAIRQYECQQNEEPSDNMGSDRWRRVMEKMADTLVQLAEEVADVFKDSDAVEWPDELLYAVQRCLFVDGGRRPETGD